MSGQFKQALKIGFSQRVTILLVNIAINLAFILAWQLGARHPAVQIVGVSISGVSLTALIVFQIISDVKIVRGVFRAPGAYTLMMAPVKGWKILLGRSGAMILLDVIGYSVGILGQIAQAFLLAGLTEIHTFQYSASAIVFWSVVVFLLYYAMLIMAIFFAEALRAGIFYRTRAKGFWGLLTAVVVLIVMSFLDFILMPFGSVYHFGPFYNITLQMSLNPGMLVFILLCLVKIAALFAATSYSIERKINV